MGQALYRKYRSKKLSELVGQEHITTALEHALKSGRVSHAYLFTGPRGVGKTSVARILAHELNDLPYTDESTHLDIIEIDAASNRRIDEIRDLRDKVHIAPSSGKYKVYIIDEVHMLTKEAFNALLKTLEEPPAHVVFILATTEVHKLPETIISRTQRFTFKPVEKAAVVAHLKTIAEQEGLKVQDDALGLLAEHGGGSFRDSISLLDMAGNTDETITLDLVRQMLGIAPQEAIHALLDACAGGSPADVHAQLEQLRGQGITAVHIAKQLSEVLRTQLLANQNTLPADVVLETLEQLLAVPSSLEPETQLEIVLYGCVIKTGDGHTGTAKPVQQPVHAAPVPSSAAPAPVVTAKPAAVRAKPIEQPDVPHIEPIKDLVEAWPHVLETIKSKQNTLYGILRQSQASWEGTALTLSFKFAFHQRRVNDARNRRVIIDTILLLTGQNTTLECLVDESVTVGPIAPLPAPEPEIVTERATTAAPSTTATLESVAHVFGGAEVLES